MVVITGINYIPAEDLKESCRMKSVGRLRAGSMQRLCTFWGKIKKAQSTQPGSLKTLP